MGVPLFGSIINARILTSISMFVLPYCTQINDSRG
jgi:hypothetical protein